jgi:uncharacterized protein YqgV (UPF0045/DUF77 family)
MIKITIEIKHDEGLISVHTKANSIGTSLEAEYAKAILEAIKIAQKYVSDQTGMGPTIESSIEKIRPVGEG